MRPPLRVLVVDDDPVSLEITRIALVRLDPAIDMRAAGDGREALAVLRREAPFAAAPTPQLVLLDWNLPVLHGREVLAHMKAEAPLAAIPVVVVSTSGDSRDIDQARALGADAYVVKAASFKDFKDSLDHVIRRFATV